MLQSGLSPLADWKSGLCDLWKLFRLQLFSSCFFLVAFLCPSLSKTHLRRMSFYSAKACVVFVFLWKARSSLVLSPNMPASEHRIWLSFTSSKLTPNHLCRWDSLSLGHFLCIATLIHSSSYFLFEVGKVLFILILFSRNLPIRDGQFVCLPIVGIISWLKQWFLTVSRQRNHMGRY